VCENAAGLAEASYIRSVRAEKREGEGATDMDVDRRDREEERKRCRTQQRYIAEPSRLDVLQ
jgi:hypothetical protein